jgi:uncharacterized membrane protein YphA (DoxX/SURF4 family)
MIDPLVPLIISVSLALLFFMAARHKLSSQRHFQAQLSAYQLLPESILPVTARALPWLEMSLVALLLIPSTRVFAAAAAALMLTVYALAMAVNLRRGRGEIDCGCGDKPQTLSIWLVARNAVLAAGALLLTVPVVERGLYLADTIFLILLTGVLSIAYLAVEQLVRNHSGLTREELQ